MGFLSLNFPFISDGEIGMKTGKLRNVIIFVEIISHLQLRSNEQDMP